MAATAIALRTDAVRRFNRFYTKQIGRLNALAISEAHFHSQKYACSMNLPTETAPQQAPSAMR